MKIIQEISIKIENEGNEMKITISDGQTTNYTIELNSGNMREKSEFITNSLIYHLEGVAMFSESKDEM